MDILRTFKSPLDMTSNVVMERVLKDRYALSHTRARIRTHTTTAGFTDFMCRAHLELVTRVGGPCALSFVADSVHGCTYFFCLCSGVFLKKFEKKSKREASYYQEKQVLQET